MEPAFLRPAQSSSLQCRRCRFSPSGAPRPVPLAPHCPSEVCGLEWPCARASWRNDIPGGTVPSLVSRREFGDLCASHVCDVSMESRHRPSLGGLFPCQRQQRMKATVSPTSRFSQTEGKRQRFPERPRGEPRVRVHLSTERNRERGQSLRPRRSRHPFPLGVPARFTVGCSGFSVSREQERLYCVLFSSLLKTCGWIEDDRTPNPTA